MRKKNREFSRSSVMYIVFGIALVGVMTLIGASAFLGINYFIISGAEKYTPEEIIEASGLSQGNNLFYLNTQTVAQRIKKALPYVDTVEITRDFPDTLSITVTESKAIAYVVFEGDTVIIDSSGRVLERSNVSPGSFTGGTNKSLIEVRGVLISDAVVGSQLKPELGVEQFVNAMKSVLILMELEGIQDDVSYLDVSNINNIFFGYQGTFRIIVGGVGELRMKLSRLPSDILKLQERYPNPRGVYNMTGEPDRYIFTPE